MSAADKGGKSKPTKAENQSRERRKIKAEKGGNKAQQRLKNKRGCVRNHDTSSFFYFFKDLSSQIFTSYETYFSKACKS